MTEDEITVILDKAHGCVESECAVNDVDDLIAELKDQQKVLNSRLETIMNVVAHLQQANTQEGRKTDDVRAIVKDMLRVFTTQVSWRRYERPANFLFKRFCAFLSYHIFSIVWSYLNHLPACSRLFRMASSPWDSVETLAMDPPLPMMPCPQSHGKT